MALAFMLFLHPASCASPSTAAVTVDLSAKPVTASVSGTPSKTFDGETDVDVALTFASGTLEGSDNFTGTVSGSFSDANAAEGKPITLGSIPVWSNQDTAGFYAIALPEHVTGTITAAEISGELAISGDAVPGSTLTAIYTAASSEEVAYQWNLDGNPIDGAGDATYTVIEQDVGHSITVTATAADGNHTGSVTSEAVVAYKRTGSITITCSDVTYGEAVQPSATSTTNEGANVTYSYVGTNGTSYGPSAEAPKDAGTYTVIATVAETATHTSATSEPTSFSINRAELATPQSLKLTSEAPGTAAASWDEVQNASGYTVQLWP